MACPWTRPAGCHRAAARTVPAPRPPDPGRRARHVPRQASRPGGWRGARAVLVRRVRRVPARPRVAVPSRPRAARCGSAMPGGPPVGRRRPEEPAEVTVGAPAGRAGTPGTARAARKAGPTAVGGPALTRRVHAGLAGAPVVAPAVWNDRQGCPPDWRECSSCRSSAVPEARSCQAHGPDHGRWTAISAPDRLPCQTKPLLAVKGADITFAHHQWSACPVRGPH